MNSFETTEIANFRTTEIGNSRVTVLSTGCDSWCGSCKAIFVNRSASASSSCDNCGKPLYINPIAVSGSLGQGESGRGDALAASLSRN